MAVLATNNLTLADWAKRTDDDGTIALIIDLLSQSNQMIDDMIWLQGNLTDGHKTTVRTGLPSGTWRMLYEGIQPTKSTAAQITERCGSLQAYSNIDKDLADLNGNTAQFRLAEDMAFYEGMSQDMQSALLYSNQVNTPAQITGFAPRYDTLNTTDAESAENVIDMGGVGSTNTSIWLVNWGENTCHGIFPRGKIGGLQHQDLGQYTQVNTDGSMYEVYRSHFKWDSGLCVRDWRYVVRLANIDVTLLNGINAANIINGLVRALRLPPTMPPAAASVQSATRPSGMVGPGRPAIYCNRTIATFLDLQAMNKTNVLLSLGEFDGKPVTMFRGIPIRNVDKLLNTEAAVTA